MKKTVIVACICGFITLSGCANNVTERGNNGIYQKSGNTLNVNNQRAELYNEKNNKSAKEKSEDFGYVRHQRNPVMGTNTSTDHYAALDREQIANIISQFGTDVPQVDDVSTLVTGKNVLIVYKTNSNNRNLTADQVKKMAFSVVPRWYHVYVTDNTNLRQDVENFATQDSNSRDIDSLMAGLIRQMVKSPQGYDLNNGENANGETKG